MKPIVKILAFKVFHRCVHLILQGKPQINVLLFVVLLSFLLFVISSYQFFMGGFSCAQATLFV
jgi:hypothetical protein